MWPKPCLTKKWAKGQVNPSFYTVKLRTCVVGTGNTGTSPLPRPIQMVALGATICMGHGNGLWLVLKAKTGSAATVATANCNLVKKGGGGGNVAWNYHDIYPLNVPPRATLRSSKTVSDGWIFYTYHRRIQWSSRDVPLHRSNFFHFHAVCGKNVAK